MEDDKTVNRINRGSMTIDALGSFVLSPEKLILSPVKEFEISNGMAQTMPEMKTFASGAKSTIKKPRYDLIPQKALELVAERFEYGATRHGERNYRKGASDQEFVTDRVNHLIEHVLRYAENRRRADLSAILCNAAILADLGAFKDEQDV